MADVSRHGRLLVSFTWLLLAVAGLTLTAAQGGGPAEASPAAAAAVFAAFGGVSIGEMAAESDWSLSAGSAGNEAMKPDRTADVRGDQGAKLHW